MNKQGKGKIGWCDWTWNPIKGLCPVGCFYCYARKMYNSKFYSKPPFDDPKIRLDGHLTDDGIIPYKLIPNLSNKKPSKIFVCSTFEIFHPEVKSLWRDFIFRIIMSYPQHTFQILTKMPENIDRPMPDNVWLGVSVTNQSDATERIPKLLQTSAKIRFLSIEPMLGSVYLSAEYHDYLDGWDVEPEHHSSCDGLCSMGDCPIPVQYRTEKLNWAIVGKLTGHGKKYDPKRDDIDKVFNDCLKNNVPIFMKNNLKDIWGEKLIQEWPK